MKDYQHDFIEFAMQRGVLRFGEFTLKSGRISPYFFNCGLFNDGESLALLGRFYALALHDSDLDIGQIYGPAYKGIPLASSLSIALYAQHQQNLPYTFNRKEIKDHGEGGQLVGAPLQGRVLIVDDVISAGTSVRESISMIQASGAIPAGVLIALDRQERGQGKGSALAEIEQQYSLPVRSIIRLEHLLNWLQSRDDMRETSAAVQRYRDRYGVA